MPGKTEMEAPDAPAAPRRGGGGGGGGGAAPLAALPVEASDIPRGRRTARRPVASALAAVPKTPNAPASAPKKRKAATSPGPAKPPKKRAAPKKAAVPATTDTSGLSLLLDAVQEVSGKGLGADFDDGMPGITPSSKRVDAPEMPSPPQRSGSAKAAAKPPPPPSPKSEALRAAQLAAAEAAVNARIAAAIRASTSDVNAASGAATAAVEGQGSADGSDARLPAAARRLAPVLRAEAERLAGAEEEGRAGPKLGRAWLRLARASQGVGAVAEARAALLRAWGVMRRLSSSAVMQPEAMLAAGEQFAALLEDQNRRLGADADGASGGATGGSQEDGAGGGAAEGAGGAGGGPDAGMDGVDGSGGGGEAEGSGGGGSGDAGGGGGNAGAPAGEMPGAVAVLPLAIAAA